MRNQDKKSQAYPFLGLPAPQGLYHPRNEHDNCGVGFVASIEGRKSHDIVLKGIQILINLTHRGACGCDPETGDGAGVLIQIPHAFFERECAQSRFYSASSRRIRRGNDFPAGGSSGTHAVRGRSRKNRASMVLTVLGWRDTPINGDMIGRLARNTQPYIEQIFIRRGPEWIRMRSSASFTSCASKRKPRLPSRIWRRRISSTSRRFPRAPSFTKACCLLLRSRSFYKELSDREVMSALCLVHQRFSTNTFPSWKLAHPYRYICHNGEINTLRGNANWMYARQSVLASPLFGNDIEKAACRSSLPAAAIRPCSTMPSSCSRSPAAAFRT